MDTTKARFLLLLVSTVLCFAAWVALAYVAAVLTGMMLDTLSYIVEIAQMG